MSWPQRRNDAASIVEVRSDVTLVPASFVLAQTQAMAANKKLWKVMRMREGKGRLMGAVSVTRGFSPHRNRQKTVAEEADSVGRLKQPRGTIRGEKGGK